LTFADIVGVKALSLLKDKNYAVFALSSFLIMFAAYFYWNWANVYLNESNMKYSQFWQSTGQMSETIFLFIMPWFFVRLGVKKMLLLGLFAWILRFVCFSYGVWGTATAALVVLGLVLHGPCYDFFFVTGQLYTDSKASKDIQAQAQGMISLITVGLGSFFGSMISGWIVDRYAIKAVVENAEKITGHHWHVIWFWPIGIMVVIIVLFFFGFHDQVKVGHDEGEKVG
jgi:MFS family permease